MLVARLIEINLEFDAEENKLVSDILGIEESHLSIENIANWVVGLVEQELERARDEKIA